MAGERLLFCKKGGSDTVTVLQREDSHKELRINDVPEVPTDYGSLQAFHLLAHLPCVLHRSPRKALVLCFGAGITTGAMATHPLERIDAVERCPDVIEANGCFLEENRNVLADRRVRLHIDEARRFLSRAEGLYDVIASDATHPRSGDSWMLYTSEFYELCAKRLRRQGIMCQWLPIHGLKPPEYRRIIRGFLDVFPGTTLWFVNRFSFLLGQRTAAPVPFRIVADRLRDERVRNDLEPLHLDDPCEFLGCFLADREALEDFTRRAHPNTDRSPIARGHTRMRLAVDTKPLNLSDLHGIRKSPAVILKGLEKVPHALAERLGRVFEAKKHILEGRIFCFRRMPAEERECYRKALKIHPEDREAKHLLAQVEFNRLLAEGGRLLEAGDAERACRLYRRAVRLNPASAAPEYNLGAVEFRRGRFDRALPLFRKAAAKTPWNAETHYNLALCYWKTGRQRHCRLELEKAVALDPGMEKARGALERLKSLRAQDPA
jgi:spermidine synthase/Flp pilus assembly protein TadD